VACPLTAAECFRKYVVANLDVTERAKGWWSMRCPIGRHGAPLRLHAGNLAHITYADLGHCSESEVFAWLVKQGVPAGCLKRPKDQPSMRRPQFGEADGRLADAILDVAFGDGTPAERLIRVTVLALGGELPEGPVVDVLAANLGVKPRIIYKATEGMRRKGRG
jgi:hypothetical protein